MDNQKEWTNGLKTTLESLSMDDKTIGVHYFQLPSSHTTHESTKVQSTLHIN
jgi:hypothetical protein